MTKYQLRNKFQVSKYQTRKIKSFFFILVIGFWFLNRHWFLDYFSPFSVVQATNMSSDNYKIQWGAVNIGGGKPGSANYSLDTSIGELTPGRFTSTNFIVRSGFQYVRSLIAFSFKISDREIALGSLSPEVLTTDSNTLTVTAGSAGGWQVAAYEAHPLRLTKQGTCGTDNCIIDTTCDDGNCTETTATAWASDSIYGFGYNAAGNNVVSGFAFTNNGNYKQFANMEAAEIPQALMSSPSATGSAVATITYKANIGTLQKAGNYETSIVFVATPTY